VHKIRRLFWTGIAFAALGVLGIAFSCFVGWIFADGEAGACTTTMAGFRR